MIYIVCTILLCTIILGFVISKNFSKLIVSINNISIQSIKGNTTNYYPAEVKKQDNNIAYEDNIADSMSRINERVFDNPTKTTEAKVQEFNSDDDLDDISAQLKGMTNNGR